uniref:Uncharacterized protein n=1 Tax=Anopheles quadriannulatus TaxID=34691 RepID=A0A182XSG6_ANOQN
MPVEDSRSIVHRSQQSTTRRGSVHISHDSSEQETKELPDIRARVHLKCVCSLNHMAKRLNVRPFARVRERVPPVWSCIFLPSIRFQSE